MQGIVGSQRETVHLLKNQQNAMSEQIDSLVLVPMYTTETVSEPVDPANEISEEPTTEVLHADSDEISEQLLSNEEITEAEIIE